MDPSFGLGVRVDRTAFESPRHRYAPVCEEEELNDGKLVGVELEGESVVVSRSEETGEVCAIAATCSHLGGPLADGTRDGDTVVCPWHGSRFDLCSGEVLGPPGGLRAAALRGARPCRQGGDQSREGLTDPPATIERWPRQPRRPTSPT